MKSYLLINPAAGLLHGLTAPEEVKSRLTGLKLDPDITIASNGQGIQAFIKKVRKDKPEVVLVAGGDGTVATVIKGLMDTGVTFGLIPTGSANNIGRSLGLGEEIEEYVKVINSAKIGKMDLGRINGEVFIESVGIGLLAEIMGRVGEQDSKKETLRVVAHTIAEVATTDIIPVHMRVNEDAEHVLNTVWLTVTNTGRAAAALVDPSSDVHDNEFEVVYCEPLSGKEIAKYVIAFVRNSHIQEDKFQRIKCSKLEITLPPKITVHVDGQLKKWQKLKIEVIPSAVKVYIP